MNKQLTVIRAALVCLSLAATFAFLAGMGTGFVSILFAIGGTLTQAAALLYLPGVMFQAWDNGRLSVAALSASFLAVVVLISVAGSASILSGLVDEQTQAAGQRASLIALADSKQESADRLIALDRITKAQPLLEEVTQIRAEVKALPAPSGFYLAAQRVGGVNADVLITGVIVALSLLLDGVALLLGMSNGSPVAAVTDNAAKPEALANVSNEQSPMNVYVVAPDPSTSMGYHNEVREVQLALESGSMRAATVRDIRAMLGCGQQKALEIARLCRSTEEQLMLL